MTSPAHTPIPVTTALDTVIGRYGDLSGDARAFARALGEPLPVCLWANPLRTEPAALAQALRDEGFSPEPVRWHPGAFRLPSGERPGLSWLYRAGLLQIQEEAALLPVRLLDPRPGERVLDLCAAPGNKTAQIAVALGNRGTVVANDLNLGRLAALQAAISRLGLVNVATTTHDGATYPAPDGAFDKVLADVPCSGEGTVRKGIGRHRPVPDEFRRQLGGVQRALLRRAIDLCRPGGRIVYSTCTFAPEENEAVIDQVLRERSHDFRVVAAEIDGLATTSGPAGWREQTFDPTLAGACRLWPHLSDTGGFFAALLERTGKPRRDPASAELPAPKTENATGPLQHFIDRFGFPDDVFSGFHVLRNGRKLRLVADDHRPPPEPPASSGLTLTRDRTDRPKLSTQAAMAFGTAATRNVVELRRNEIDRYFDRDPLPLDSGRLAACDGPGRVLLRHHGHGLGIGILKRGDDGWMLESLFPKAWG